MSIVTNVNIVIDTDGLLKKYPSGSTDPNNPTPVSHEFEYMVVNGNNSISGQGGADLNFAAAVGDEVRFSGVSGSNNFENQVQIIGIKRYGGDQVFSTFEVNSFTKSSYVPSNSSNGLPVTFADRNFSFLSASVTNRGTENYQVQFAVYVRDRDHQNPVLNGYYQWDPTITVNS